MALKLEPHQTAEDAAHLLLGDRRLTNEVEVIGGYAYIKGERQGPAAKYAAPQYNPPAKRS